jgi:hypothetical protein
VAALAFGPKGKLKDNRDSFLPAVEAPEMYFKRHRDWARIDDKRNPLILSSLHSRAKIVTKKYLEEGGYGRAVCLVLSSSRLRLSDAF